MIRSRWSPVMTLGKTIMPAFGVAANASMARSISSASAHMNRGQLNRKRRRHFLHGRHV